MDFPFLPIDVCIPHVQLGSVNIIQYKVTIEELVHLSVNLKQGYK